MNDLDLMRRNTLGDQLRKNARKFPDKTALTFYPGGTANSEKFTFKELNAAANRFANALREMGLVEGDVVGLYFHNCSQFIIATYGLLKANIIATLINVNLVDREIAYQVNHSDTKMLIVEDSFMNVIANIKDEIKNVQHFGFVSLNDEPVPDGWVDINDLYSEKYSDKDPEVIINNNDVAFRLYTSGTTAFPKGINLTHSNLEYISHSWAGSNNGAGIDVDDVQGYFLPLYHSAIVLVQASISVGSHLVLGDLSQFEEALETIEKEKVTWWGVPVTAFARLVNSPNREKARSIKKAMWFGGAMPLGVLSEVFDFLPDIKILPQWSQTECLVGTLTWLDKNTGLPSAGNIIGKPYLDTEIKLVNPDDEEVPVGESGEIVMRSPAIMKEYHKNPEATAEAFLNGWHHTGDVGLLAEDGYYYFVDRVKDMIKTGGVNVSAMEVEAVIESMPGIKDSAVFGVVHPDWAEAIVCVVVAENGDITEKKVIDYCKANSAKFKVPKKVFFEDKIPVNHVGKKLRKNLRDTHKDLFKG